jgi:hypothetical protein
MEKTTIEAEAAPPWLLEMLADIDGRKLDAAFRQFADDAEMYLGRTHVAGVQAIKDAIQAIPAGDRHTLHEFWDLGGVKVTWGKTSAGTPFTFLLYMSEDGKVRTFRVTSGP